VPSFDRLRVVCTQLYILLSGGGNDRLHTDAAILHGLRSPEERAGEPTQHLGSKPIEE
jgi:hypothetical protein